MPGDGRNRKYYSSRIPEFQRSRRSYRNPYRAYHPSRSSYYRNGEYGNTQSSSTVPGLTVTPIYYGGRNTSTPGRNTSTQYVPFTEDYFYNDDTFYTTNNNSSNQQIHQQISRNESAIIPPPVTGVAMTATAAFLNATTENVEHSQQPVQSDSANNQNVQSMNNSRGTSDPFECAVCLENYQWLLSKGMHLSAVNCGHVFCNLCINSFIDSGKCPLCRSYINYRNIRQLRI